MDSDRTAVYAAERAAFEGTALETNVEFATLRRWCVAIVAAPWWTGGAVDIGPARSDAHRSSATEHDDGECSVRLARTHTSCSVLNHELAHVLAGVARGHDALFRRAIVDITLATHGIEPSAWLLDAFAAFDLDLAERTWPAPRSLSVVPVFAL